MEFDPKEDVCPICKSDRYLNPEMHMLVSPCYHRVCDTCVSRVYAHGSAPCPICGTILRRTNFVTPTFENLRVEKECRIRKKIAVTFNKREEDFETLRDYNDYLEEVEEIVFNLVDEIDVQKTYAKLEAYRRQNLDLIAKNQELLKMEEIEHKKQLEEEELARFEYDAQVLAEMEAEDSSRFLQEQQFIDQLTRTKATSKRAAVRETKRTAEQEAATISLRGLRSKKSTEANDMFDPLEYVAQIPLDVWDLSSMEKFLPPRCHGDILMAGGMNPHLICIQLATYASHLGNYSCAPIAAAGKDDAVG